MDVKTCRSLRARCAWPWYTDPEYRRPRSGTSVSRQRNPAPAYWRNPGGFQSAHFPRGRREWVASIFAAVNGWTRPVLWVGKSLHSRLRLRIVVCDGRSSPSDISTWQKPYAYRAFSRSGKTQVLSRKACLGE